MRIVALRASGRTERLSLVGLNEGGVRHIVTVRAQRWCRFGQMVVEFLLALRADFVREVATLATHIDRGMVASLLGSFCTFGVAVETEIRAFAARRGLEQLILVVGNMRVVTFDAVAHGGRVYGPFEFGRVLVRMASDAERLRSRGDELYAGDIFVDPDFMAAQTTHRNSRVDGLACCPILMTFQALGSVGGLLQWHWVNRGSGVRNQQHEREESQDFNAMKAAPAACDLLAKPDAMGEKSHTASQRGYLHDSRRITKKRLQVARYA